MNLAIVKTQNNSKYHVYLEPASSELPSNILSGEVIFQGVLNQLFQTNLKQVNPKFCEMYFRYPWAKGHALEIVKLSCDADGNEKCLSFQFNSHEMTPKDQESFELVFGTQKNEMNS
ncbi:hypothetical protein A3752_21960 [Oleiphilus sp. HI0081]|nr:hypothetical protein A3752_21960 [Oleiphilus sp. HI0081]